MKYGGFVLEPHDIGGYSGQAKRWVKLHAMECVRDEIWKFRT
jgi:hypothetical protein